MDFLRAMNKVRFFIAKTIIFLILVLVDTNRVDLVATRTAQGKESEGSVGKHHRRSEEATVSFKVSLYISV